VSRTTDSTEMTSSIQLTNCQPHVQSCLNVSDCLCVVLIENAGEANGASNHVVRVTTVLVMYRPYVFTSD